MSASETVTQIIIFFDALASACTAFGFGLWLAVRYFTGIWNWDVLVLWVSASVVGIAIRAVLKRRVKLENAVVDA